MNLRDRALMGREAEKHLSCPICQGPIRVTKIEIDWRRDQYLERHGMYGETLYDRIGGTDGVTVRIDYACTYGLCMAKARVELERPLTFSSARHHGWDVDAPEEIGAARLLEAKEA